MRIVHLHMGMNATRRSRKKKFLPFVKQIPQLQTTTVYLKTSEVYWMQQTKIIVTPMQEWQLSIKRMIDIFASFISMVILFPILIYIALRTKFSSAGPLFYFQERIGKNGKPFRLIKFRSMFLNAEKNGPQLSHKTDSRITPWGKTMRQWRLDELPQLWNIFKGEMSFVGPRPERRFFVKQLVALYPNFKLLQKIKPGLSSFGMVRFGYAENIEEMLERSRYDFIYLQKPSLAFDVKVVLQTIKVIFFNKSQEFH